MKKIAILSAMMFAVALWFGSTVSADPCPPDSFVDDGCGENNDHTDVSTVTVTSDGTNITVDVLLCGAIPANDKTKYRLHIDHWGTTALDNSACLTTSDDTMMIRRIGTPGEKTTGPGVILESGEGTTTITFIVAYTALVDDGDNEAEAGDILLFWVDTHHRGIQDRAPDTEGESCSKPDECDEVIQHELNEVT